jgi:hypothetical protein
LGLGRSRFNLVVNIGDQLDLAGFSIGIGNSDQESSIRFGGIDDSFMLDPSQIHYVPLTGTDT